jgi:flagellar protein FlgJ
MQVSPINSTPAAARPPHDLAALKRGGLDPAEQRAAVGSQFEAILLRQFLQESLGSMMGGTGGNLYGFMLTDSLAQKLSEGGGMGLAPIIAQQLTPRGQSGSTLPAATPKS